MERFGPQPGVDADAERTGDDGAPAAAAVEDVPPARPPQPAGQAADLQGAAEKNETFDRIRLVLAKAFVEGEQRLVFGGGQVGEEDGVFALVEAFDCDGGDAEGMLVEARPGEGEVGAGELRRLDGRPGQGLGEDGAPADTAGRTGPHLHQIGDVHAPLDRDGGDATGKVEQVADQPARRRQRQRPSRLFAHGASPRPRPGPSAGWDGRTALRRLVSYIVGPQGWTPEQSQPAGARGAPLDFGGVVGKQAGPC